MPWPINALNSCPVDVFRRFIQVNPSPVLAMYVSVSHGIELRLTGIMLLNDTQAFLDLR